jgi:hypothetical protein
MVAKAAHVGRWLRYGQAEEVPVTAEVQPTFGETEGRISDQGISVELIDPAARMTLAA